MIRERREKSNPTPSVFTETESPYAMIGFHWDNKKKTENGFVPYPYPPLPKNAIFNADADPGPENLIASSQSSISYHHTTPGNT